MRFSPLDARSFYEIDQTEEFDNEIDGFGPNMYFEIIN